MVPLSKVMILKNYHQTSVIHRLLMTPNGPPVELVSVAERLEAVTTKVLLLLRAESRHTAGRSAARRGFCLSGHKLSELYVCRVTRFIVSRL